MIKNDIGTNAGVIWNLLSGSKKMTIREIGERTHDRDAMICFALGWLAREDKVYFTVEDDGTLSVSIKDAFAETYY